MWELLIAAIEKFDEVEAIKLIDKMKPKEFNKNYSKLPFFEIPLHYAARLGLREVVDKLLNINPELINVTDENGKTALIHAISFGSDAILNIFLKINSGLVGIVDGKGKTALHYAAENGKKGMVNKILSSNPELAKVVDQEGKTALHYAAQNGNESVAGCFSLEMINFVLRVKDKQNDDPNILSYLNKSAEYFVNLIKKYPDSIDQYYKLGNILLGSGKRAEGLEAYKKVLELDSVSYAEKIISNLAIMVDSDNKQSALNPVGTLSYDKIIQIILDKIPSEILNAVDRNNKTMLYRAAEIGKDKVIELLLGKMELLAISQTITKAAKEGQKKVIEILIKIMSSKAIAMTDKKGEAVDSPVDNEIAKNSWYSDDKLNKLLHLKLDNNSKVSIAPVTEFKNKKLLIENVLLAAKEVMENAKIAVMPIYLHNNHWSALVIKKQADGNLQILYNDPQGDSLMSEKNSGTLIKAISKISGEFTLVDIRLKQQSNDDDHGLYTIENLIKLANMDTSNMHKDQLQQLLKLGGNASIIRINHENELVKSNSSNEYKIEFVAMASFDNHGVEATGISGNEHDNFH